MQSSMTLEVILILVFVLQPNGILFILEDHKNHHFYIIIFVIKKSSFTVKLWVNSGWLITRNSEVTLNYIELVNQAVPTTQRVHNEKRYRRLSAYHQHFIICMLLLTIQLHDNHRPDLYIFLFYERWGYVSNVLTIPLCEKLNLCAYCRYTLCTQCKLNEWSSLLIIIHREVNGTFYLRYICLHTKIVLKHLLNYTISIQS